MGVASYMKQLCFAAKEIVVLIRTNKTEIQSRSYFSKKMLAIDLLGGLTLVVFYIILLLELNN